MRCALIVFVLFLAAGTQVAFAEIPKTMSYQGVLMDNEGYPVDDGDYEVTFRIYDQESGGSALWTEVDSVTVSHGVFDAILGKKTSLDLAFDSAYWLSLEVEGGGELSPRVELTGSPYTFRAAVAESAVVASGGMGGSGTNGRIPRFFGSTTLGNSRIYESGDHVSIGQAPTAYGDLQVYGDMGLLRFYNPSTGTGLCGLAIGYNNPSGLNATFHNHHNGYLQFGTYGQVRMRITADGLVGVGTLTPSAKLEVDGDEASTGVYGRCVESPGHGTGGHFVGGGTGVLAEVNGTDSEEHIGVCGSVDGGSGPNHGVEGYAHGSGINVGVLGEATGGTENYAGYFFGAVRINGHLWLEPKLAPPNPSGGFVIYVDSSDNKLKAKSGDGTVTVLANY